MSWFSASAMGTGRGGGHKAYTVNGKIYVIAGEPKIATAYDPMPNTRLDEYTPGTNTWTQKASAPLDTFQVTAASGVGYEAYWNFVPCNNTLHAWTGYQHLFGEKDNRHRRYNPANNTWESRALFPQNGNLPLLADMGQKQSASCWMLGSQSAWENGNDANAAYRFDDATNTYTYLGSRFGAGRYREHAAGNTMWFLSTRGATGFGATQYLETLDLDANTVTQGPVAGSGANGAGWHYLSSRGYYYQAVSNFSNGTATFVPHNTTDLGTVSTGGQKGGGGPQYGGWTTAAVGQDIYPIGGGTYQMSGYGYPVWVAPYVSTAWRWNPDFPAASALTPVAGSTVNTDLPTVGLTVAASGGEKQTARWQLARDAGFSTSLREVLDDAYVLSGGLSQAIEAASAAELFQGLWYIRGRGENGSDQYTPWTAAHTFTVDHKPAGSTISPSGDQTINYQTSGTVTFEWGFSDTSPTDFQSAWQIICERNDNGVLVFDTGKVASQNLRSYTYNFAAAQKDVQLRWKIRVWDSDDITAGYSNYALFRVSDIPVVAVTDPAEGSTTGSTAPQVTWTFTASGGRTQASHRVRFWQSGAVIHDSGVRSGAATTYTPDSSVLGAGQFTVQVDVTDNVGLAGTDSNTFNVSFVPPASPDFVLDPSLYENGGFIRVTWTPEDKDGQWTAWRVRRRIAGSTDRPELVYETDLDLTNYTFDDYSAGSGVTYEYFVVQVASRGGVGAESAYNNGETTIAYSTKYWLIHPSDPSKNILIGMVTGEDFADEYETETLNLIGRGRKVDYGTYLGYKGTLTAQLRNETGGRTARAQRLALQELKRDRQQMYLRNPFGDVFLVDLGNLSFGRISGVGMHEAVDVSIPYEELK